MLETWQLKGPLDFAKDTYEIAGGDILIPNGDFNVGVHARRPEVEGHVPGRILASSAVRLGLELVTHVLDRHVGVHLSGKCERNLFHTRKSQCL